MEGNQEGIMDGEVRATRAAAPISGSGLSHTVHSIPPASTASNTLAGAPRTRRDPLAQATGEPRAESSVDRLRDSRDAQKALYS